MGVERRTFIDQQRADTKPGKEQRAGEAEALYDVTISAEESGARLVVAPMTDQGELIVDEFEKVLTLKERARAALAEAEEQGLKIHPDVRCYIQCGSLEVREYCREQGYMDLFERMGAEFIEPGCGACINAGPGVTASADEVSISSQNRNFPGRSGPGNLYLASPYSVAASAVAA